MNDGFDAVPVDEISRILWSEFWFPNSPARIPDTREATLWWRGSDWGSWKFSVSFRDIFHDETEDEANRCSGAASFGRS